MTPSTAIAQLRHLCQLMLHNRIDGAAGLEEAASRLLGPAIAALEAAHPPTTDPETARLHAAVQEAGVDGGLGTSAAIEALERHEAARRAPVEVKPLVWRDSSSPHRAIYHGRCGDREVCQIMKDSLQVWSLMAYGHHARPTYPTLAAAQVAAAEQWSAFIRAAVEETP